MTNIPILDMDITPAGKAREEAWRLLDDSKKTHDPRRRKELLVRAFELAQMAEQLTDPADRR